MFTIERVSVALLTGLVLSCATQSKPAVTPSPEPAAAEQPASEPASTSVDPPQTISSGAVHIGCGFLLAESHDDVHFHVTLFGDDIQPRSTTSSEGSYQWFVDGIPVETTIAMAEQIGEPHLRRTDLLRRYMEWEMKYTAKKNGWPPTRPDLAKTFQVNGVYVSAWTYHFPTPVPFLGQEITGIVYGTAAIEHVVFVITSPFRHSADVEPAVDAVFNALKTVTRTAEPLDLKAISREIKSGSTRWCSERPANAPSG